MKTSKKIAAVVLVASGMILLSNGLDGLAGAVTAPKAAQKYEAVTRTVMPGQNLWSICSKLNSSEDIRAIIDRCRADNNIADPGALQPGKVLLIRYKR